MRLPVSAYIVAALYAAAMVYLPAEDVANTFITKYWWTTILVFWAWTFLVWGWRRARPARGSDE